MANNDNEERTAQDEANDLESIIAVPDSAEKEEQEPRRSLPSPESPPPPSRRPWPGTNKIIEPAKYANDVDHGEIYNAKAPARGAQSFLWHDTASTIIKTVPVKQKECIPQKTLPPAKPPPAQPRRTKKKTAA